MSLVVAEFTMERTDPSATVERCGHSFVADGRPGEDFDCRLNMDSVRRTSECIWDEARAEHGCRKKDRRWESFITPTTLRAVCRFPSFGFTSSIYPRNLGTNRRKSRLRLARDNQREENPLLQIRPRSRRRNEHGGPAQRALRLPAPKRIQRQLLVRNAGRASRRSTNSAARSSRRCSKAKCSTKRCATACSRWQMDGEMEELIEKLIERMQQEDYISIDQPHDPSRRSSVGGQVGENAAAGKIRNHRQEPRLPGLQSAARPARLARQIQLRTPRHARHGHRHRSQRRVEALRIRRHAQPRHHRHALKCHPARRARPAAEHRVPRPAGPSMRVPVKSARRC